MNRTQKTDLLHKFISVINELPDDTEPDAVMIFVKDDAGGTSFGKTDGWDDDSLLTVMCHVRSEMDCRGDVDILVEGEDLELE